MQSPAPGRVLVVDDNAENRALAQATLEDERYDIELAVDGAQGLAAFIARPPDCVLLDIRMPGTDGITVCRRMREVPGAQDIPILFLTAQRDVDTFDRAQAAGGDDYITKPVRPTELVARVANAVKQRRMATERGELYAEVRRQRDALLRLQLQTEQLTAFLVHDLKNPVNAIELHTQRVLREANATPRSRDAALRIGDETRALMRMIMNLLDIGRADEGRLTPARTQLAASGVIGDVVTSMQVRASSTNVTVASTVASDVVVTADADLLRRLLENLVDNAIRHSPEESTITIAAQRADGGCELRVIDQGPGVPPDKREHVFERFATQGASERNRGLGLTFCKLVADAHGGRIWIEDALPGAAFCLWLPDATA